MVVVMLCVGVQCRAFLGFPFRSVQHFGTTEKFVLLQRLLECAEFASICRDDNVIDGQVDTCDNDCLCGDCHCHDDDGCVDVHCSACFCFPFPSVQHLAQQRNLCKLVATALEV
eukprot:TRINITY_DN7662_c1_g1_i1.p2 TRINITY_DN7662_c1_g1~~TRINITY_DN7662_c1_g1_i1.p2  ORF type:complete len:114 (-),score=18.40 TRINITY_DN7662_c1_g1_i1:50-391(-)